jgi:hypothetical protein
MNLIFLLYHHWLLHLGHSCPMIGGIPSIDNRIIFLFIDEEVNKPIDRPFMKIVTWFKIQTLKGHEKLNVVGL